MQMQLHSVRLPRDVIPVSALLYAGACRRLIESKCRLKNTVDVRKNWEAGKGRRKTRSVFLDEVVSAAGGKRVRESYATCALQIQGRGKV